MAALTESEKGEATVFQAKRFMAVTHSSFTFVLAERMELPSVTGRVTFILEVRIGESTAGE